MMYAVCKTDVGRVRANNQDICSCGVMPDGSAWSVVCDGMGGVKGGNIASSIACEEISRYITAHCCGERTDAEIRSHMVEAVEQANRAVLQKSQEEPDLHGMGTTVVVSVVKNDQLHVVHVGDSRCYLKTALGVKQITTDHSFVQQLVESGVITEEEARVHPKRNLITRVVGVHLDVACDYTAVPFVPGSMAIACTDGLSAYLERDTLGEFLEQYQGEQLAEALIAFANSKGGHDNITVAVIDHKESGREDQIDG